MAGHKRWQATQAGVASPCCWALHVKTSPACTAGTPPTQEILGIVEAHLAEMDSINSTAALQRLARVGAG